MAYNNTISIPVDNPERLSSEDSVNLPEISSASKIINKSFGNVDDFIYITNKLDKGFYNTKKEIIEENYQLALKYVDYEKNIINKITEIFKHNNLT